MGINTKSSRKAIPQELKFINVTNEGRTLDAASQRMIRVQAMRDFRSRQRLRLQMDSEKNVSAAPYRRPQMLVSGPAMQRPARTRCGSPSTNRKAAACKAGSDDDSLSIRDQCDRTMFLTSTRSESTPDFDQPENEKIGQPIFGGTSTYCNSLATSREIPALPVDDFTVIRQDERGSRSSLVCEESLPPFGKLDPFDVIPAPNTDRIQILIHHCKPLCMTYHRNLTVTRSPYKVSPKTNRLNSPRAQSRRNNRFCRHP